MSVPKRRFGKTGLQMPVITCGGMRLKFGTQLDLNASL
jgi:predicted aldo/keto reductase-like oxidoreductase